MKIIGLTGGIASGKSTASKMLQDDGHYPIIDADRIARETVMPGSKAMEKIAAFFGRDMLTPQGEMDRKKMGVLISRDPEAKQQLEDITHPIIIQKVNGLLDHYRQQGESIVIYDCPLLFESGSDDQADGFMLITAPVDLRLKRLMDRENMDRETAWRRIAIQMTDEEKIAMAKKTGKPVFIVNNDRDLKALSASICCGIKELEETLCGCSRYC